MKKYLILLILSFAITGISCIKKDLHEPVNIETTIKIDWSNMENDDIIDILTVKINESIFSVIEGEQLSSVNLKPGQYNIYTYNIPVGITINEETASVNHSAGGNIISYKSIFYSSYNNITINNESPEEITVVPMRNSKEFTMNVNYTSEHSIQSIKGTINNVAAAFDLTTQLKNNPENIDFDFTDNNSTINTFGFIGTDYLLSLELTLTGDTIIMKYRKDISDILNNFNEDGSFTKTVEILIDDDELTF